MSEFFEEDEPVEKVRAAFERGAKGVTVPPYGMNLWLDVPGVPCGMTVGASANVIWEDAA